MTQYFSFKNRAMRSEYWGVQVLGLVSYLIIAFIAGFFIGLGDETGSIMASLVGLGGFVSATLVYTWLVLATTVRRCRDAGVSVWWTAGVIIPYVGWVVLIALGIIKTDELVDTLPRLNNDA